MIIGAIIIGIALVVLIAQCIRWNSEDENETYGFGVFCGLSIAALFILEIMCICGSISEPSPEAMDVYQGKTTLEYTIRDGVKVDSIVVFKEK